VGIDDVGAFEEDGGEGGELSAIEIIDELLAEAVHLGADDDGQMKLVGKSDNRVEVLELFGPDAGGEVAVGDGVYGGDAGIGRNIEELFDVLLAFAGSVEPGEGWDCTCGEDEFVGLVHEGEGAAIRLDIADTASFHGAGTDGI